MSYEKDNTCRFCNKAFHSAKTLLIHQCPKKIRFAELSTTASRIAYSAFQRFFELTSKPKNPKTEEDFINSPLYIGFLKFGKFVVDIKPIYPSEYVDFLINKNVALDEWRSEFMYDAYLKLMIQKEPLDRALDRTIRNIDDWCMAHNTEFSDFFVTINANEICWLIKTGKISPWVVYLSSKSSQLLSSFNEDHNKMVSGIMELAFWKKRFMKDLADVEFVQNIIKECDL